METYTREQIERGEGFFTSGARTLIYRRHDGRYITASRHDQPGAGLTLVGGGHLQKPSRNGIRRPQIDWCE
jgi:hypothetical protein